MKIATLVAALLLFAGPVLADNERLGRIQEALMWLGFLDGPVAEEWNAETTAAVEDFQERIGVPITGEITEKQADVLLEKVRELRDDLDFRVVRDESINVQFGYPAALLTSVIKTPAGRRFQNQKGDISLDVYSSIISTHDLNTKIAQMQVQNEILEITSNAGDILIRGRNLTEAFQIRVFDDGRGLTSGYTLIYPRSEESFMGTVAKAIDASFRIDYVASPSGRQLKEVLSSLTMVTSVGEPLDPIAFYERIAASVFTIVPSMLRATDASPPTQGAGVAISDRHVLTSCHVISGWSRADLLQDDQMVGSARLISSDLIGDLCLLETDGELLQSAPAIRAFGSLKVGETVYAIGSPAGFDRSLSNGIISGLRRKDDARWVQTTAVVAQGSSGGGLFDAAGNLIGPMSFIISASRELNFAVAADRPR